MNIINKNSTILQNLWHREHRISTPREQERFKPREQERFKFLQVCSSAHNCSRVTHQVFLSPQKQLLEYTWVGGHTSRLVERERERENREIVELIFIVNIHKMNPKMASGGKEKTEKCVH